MYINNEYKNIYENMNKDSKDYYLLVMGTFLSYNNS